jgi:ABC-type branched-subunit amino acid transport system ATPase component/ABC-type branched-subunit amino acid transport system permease subunit
VLHVAFLLLGLGNGATYAALALALVLVFRSSGVVNFATGASALYAAYTFTFLRQGYLVNPFPGAAAMIGIGGPLELVPALVVSLAVATLLGALMYLIVFRQLRNAPAVTRAVASVGVMLVLQADLAQRFGTQAIIAEPVFPDGSLRIAGEAIRADRLYFAATVVVLAGLIAAMSRWTRFGLATRAASESEKGAYLSGLAPSRIALANWALAGGVSGLAGILIAPLAALAPTTYTLFVVPALPAAVMAGFSSIGVCVAVGLAIGMIQSEVGYLQIQHAWLPQYGLADIVPLVLLVAYLTFRGRPLPQRGSVVLRTLGHAPRPRHILAPTLIGVAAALVALALTSGNARLGVMTTLIFAILALSLVVVTGFCGQVSLAQLGLAGVGAFTLSRLTAQLHVPFPFAPLLAATAASAVGVLFALPALRIRGLPVAVVTLALAVGLDDLWFQNPSFAGGSQGGPVVEPHLFGLDLGVGTGRAFPRLAFGLLCLVALVAVALCVVRLRNSTTGAAMLAVRANERAAAAAGVDVARTKITAFAIAAFLAGLGGALYAYQQTVATPDSYSSLSGLALFATVYLCGVTSVGGGVLAGIVAVGGVFYTALNSNFVLGGWYQVISGLGFVNVAIRRPEGLVAPLHELLARRRKRRQVHPPEPGPPGYPARSAAPAEGASALSVRGVTVKFGEVVALDGVHLDVPAGAVVGVIGPNGAGKTTLMDVISGFTRPVAGAVFRDDISLDPMRPHERARAGLGRTFQNLELYDDLTIAENIAVGARRGQHGRASDRVDRIARLLSLEDRTDEQVRLLSQGERQLVSIGRALAGEPRVLLLDEPAGGLDTTETAWFGDRLHVIRESGMSIVLVDHDMDLVLSVCDYVYVLDLGTVIASGPPSRVRRDHRVLAAYLGQDDGDTIPEREATS